MPSLARLERLEARNRRVSARRKLTLGATLATTGDEVVIHDLSSTGILIETKAGLSTSEKLEVELPEVGPTLATVVWNSGQYFGCQFAGPIPRSALSAALLRNPAALPLHPNPETISTVETVETEEVSEGADKFSLTVRLRVVLGLSIGLWALILWAIGVI